MVITALQHLSNLSTHDDNDSLPTLDVKEFTLWKSLLLLHDDNSLIQFLHIPQVYIFMVPPCLSSSWVYRRWLTIGEQYAIPWGLVYFTAYFLWVKTWECSSEAKELNTHRLFLVPFLPYFFIAEQFTNSNIYSFC